MTCTRPTTRVRIRGAARSPRPPGDGRGDLLHRQRHQGGRYPHGDAVWNKTLAIGVRPSNAFSLTNLHLFVLPTLVNKVASTEKEEIFMMLRFLVQRRVREEKISIENSTMMGEVVDEKGDVSILLSSSTKVSV